jgi:hypothetical protein
MQLLFSFATAEINLQQHQESSNSKDIATTQSN